MSDNILYDTIASLAAQCIRLGQCVLCNEMDEQDGLRVNGSFVCHECLDDAKKRYLKYLTAANADSDSHCPK